MAQDPSDRSDERPDTKHVPAGSDADATPVAPVGKTPGNPNGGSAPLETEDGDQMDDNVDDLGNKQGGGKIDQPT